MPEKHTCTQIDSDDPPSVESGAAISVHSLGKCYRVYARPQDRLKQALWRGRRQYFQEFWALRDVSLEIPRGETVGIMGRNGCGKSTLLQLICNTLTPTTGEIRVAGRISALLELGAGFNPEFTGRDNIYTNAAVLGLSRKETDQCYEQIVAFSELGDFIDRPVKTYSSGMYVRLAFSVATSVEPDILIVDEALAVGDEAFQRKCFARIQAIQERGGTILLVSHGAGTILELCNRAALLDRGELLMIGRPKDVVTMYQRLLYAPADRAASIREEIKHLNQNEGTTALSNVSASTNLEPSESVPSSTETADHKNATGNDSTDDDVNAYFDAEMKPKSTVVYETNGAEIFDPHIVTLSGRRVNILVPHREYEVRYRARFTKPAFHVVWGTVVKTVEGTVVSSMMQPSMTNRHEHVPADTDVELGFRFRCSLMPGVYFANVGVHGTVGGQEGFLHRLVDGLMFRVTHGHKRSESGIADLFLESRIAFEPRFAEKAA